MGNQLELFREADHFHISIDSKHWDFVMYNATSYRCSDEEILPEDMILLKYKELPPIIQKLKSEAWSCGCKWLFAMQDEGIYLMNVYDEHFWLCRKHSTKFMDMYLDAPLFCGREEKKEK